MNLLRVFRLPTFTMTVRTLIVLLVLIKQVSLTNGQCIESIANFTTCITQNFLTCSFDACSQVDSSLNATDCNAIDETCSAFNCCSECAQAGKDAFSCALTLLGCNRTCDDASPVAPTPTAPSPIAPVSACDAEDLAFENCLQTNMLECYVACSSIVDISLETCSDWDAACPLIACCPPCVSDAKASINCNLGIQQCGTTCDTAPVAPTPTAPSALPPGLGCANEAIALSSCFVQNIADCLFSCADTSLDNFTECSSFDSFCQGLTCCPPCLSEGKDYLECEGANLGCGSTCDAAPVAPSPVAPSSLVPGFACVEVQVNHTLCLLENILECGFSCEFSQLENCTFASEACSAQACCPPCLALGKALVNCELEQLGCDATCDLAPVAPTPVAPITMSPMSLPPAAQCSMEDVALALCIGANFLQCATACFGSDEVQLTCDSVETDCRALACCPECLDEAKTSLNCHYLQQACPTTCDDVAPVAPSPAAPTPLFPTSGCAAEQGAFAFCIGQNVQECALACAFAGGFNFDCNTVDEACAALDCCPPCLEEGRAFLNCDFNASACPAMCESVPSVPSAAGMPVTSVPRSLAPVSMSPEGGTSEAPVSSPPEGGTSEAPVSSPPEGGTSEAPVSSPPVGGTTTAPTTQSPATGSPAANVTAAPSGTIHVKTISIVFSLFSMVLCVAMY